jgi:hypothetical protein
VKIMHCPNFRLNYNALDCFNVTAAAVVHWAVSPFQCWRKRMCHLAVRSPLFTWLLLFWHPWGHSHAHEYILFNFKVHHLSLKTMLVSSIMHSLLYHPYGMWKGVFLWCIYIF